MCVCVCACVPHVCKRAGISEYVHRGLTQFEQPAFTIGVEEGVGEIIPIILRDFKGLISDAVIEVLREKNRLATPGP